MAVTLKHAFTSSIADDAGAAAAGQVLPSHWNAAHALTGSVANAVLYGDGIGVISQDANHEWIPGLLINRNDALITPPSSSFDGLVNYAPSAFGNYATLDTIIFAPGDPSQQLTLAGSSTFIVDNTVSFSAAGIFNGMSIMPSFKSTAVAQSVAAGLDIRPVLRSDGTGRFNPFSGMLCTPTNYSSGLLDQFSAIQCNAINSPSGGAGGGAMSDLSCQGHNFFGVLNFYDSINLQPSNRFSGNITNRYSGLYVLLYQDTGATSGNSYGIYIDNSAGIGSTVSENFHSAGSTSINVLEGNLQIGLNNTSPHRLEVYNTWTNTTNFERGVLDWTITSNTLRLMMEKGGGGGTSRIIAIDGFQKAGAAVAGDLPSGSWGLVHDTSGATFKLCYNDAGTLKTVALV